MPLLCLECYKPRPKGLLNCLVPLVMVSNYYERFWPLKLLWSCPSCHQEGSLKVEAMRGVKSVLITSKGNLCIPNLSNACAACNALYNHFSVACSSVGIQEAVGLSVLQWPPGTLRISLIF